MVGEVTNPPRGILGNRGFFGRPDNYSDSAYVIFPVTDDEHFSTPLSPSGDVVAQASVVA
jgi:hypothetical protein